MAYGSYVVMTALTNVINFHNALISNNLYQPSNHLLLHHSTIFSEKALCLR